MPVLALELASQSVGFHIEGRSMAEGIAMVGLVLMGCKTMNLLQHGYYGTDIPVRCEGCVWYLVFLLLWSTMWIGQRLIVDQNGKALGK